MSNAATNAPLVRVCLVRPHLEALPASALPTGFALRLYRLGDRDRWVEIVSAADSFQPISATTHEAAFGQDAKAIAERQLFLVAPGGQLIGTATAWHGQGERWQSWGRVHWLAVSPAWQGRGFGKVLLAATLQRLRELGHARAYLTTETVRLTAIRLYLRLGFTPDLTEVADRAAWRDLRSRGVPVQIPAEQTT